ncbi:chromate transporter [Fusobacterium canifelinum]|uniref:Chromate transporter n=1 Tax=Fusobacterium canifelinum TaxID=285729 RepID=A0A7T9LDM7_9FUSO|nr:chromate transporter [Fusobacterium canifelinum]QQB73494.1 chromate transporter [Fusobacterium canifelinum]QQS87001.1 chromate transporter [Fusobacterium canifelinum]
MTYFNLFLVFFKVGLFSFGGGYAILPLMQHEVVDVNKWISFKEFMDIVAVSQITPGPISINLATHVGYRIGGTLGSTIATTSVILPSIIIISLIVIFLKRFSKLPAVQRIFKSLRVTIVGLILAAGIALFVKENFIDYKSYIIFASVLIGGLVFKIGSITLIILSGVAGVILYYFI